MSVTSTKQAKAGVQVTQPILQTNTEFSTTDNPASNFVQAAEPGPRHVGYADRDPGSGGPAKCSTPARRGG